MQSIAERRGRSARRLARAWTRQLAAAVRSQDDRPVTIGLLPLLQGSFVPAYVADLLDMLVVHEYPQGTAGSAGAGGAGAILRQRVITARVAASPAAGAVALVRGFASFKKPVLLGETFVLQR